MEAQVDVQNLFRRCDTVFWAFGPCIFVEPIRGASRLLHNPRVFINSRHILVRGRFCLSLDLSRTVVVDRFVRPQLVSLIIHSQYSRLCSFLFLLVSSILRQELALMARSIAQCTVDNQRRSGAAIAGF
jgi:hypothetical protein